ncbi:hypothetical protein CH063_13735 [Colletotrichum higginsianum]|uniref:Uncharacterized protein n=1 Tax=Colletotrichum higginsianum (strain IMI 349063) TaxID=759273 RepID=H1VVM2_COLHI|nr:hypothetical protein CH063_13735 [Colletotrichum higginsianum]
MIALHAETSELEQMRGRVHVLEAYIEQESASANDLLQILRSDDYKPANDLARQNLDMQRKIKAMAARIPEHKDRDEADYLNLLAQKKGLDAEVDQFSGLPDDLKTARAELEHLRAEVRAITQHRDAIFEGLVERESPRKGR